MDAILLGPEIARHCVPEGTCSNRTSGAMKTLVYVSNLHWQWRSSSFGLYCILGNMLTDPVTYGIFIGFQDLV